MKERPILFSTPMVQAILEGRKTQTRRIVKQPDLIEMPDRFKYVGNSTEIDLPRPAIKYDERVYHNFQLTNSNACDWILPCPYGKPGDRLWVRETYSPVYCPTLPEEFSHYAYKADNDPLHSIIKWKPSIFMPRSACRIFLDVVSVKVERLQDITDQDCFKEGIIYNHVLEGYNTNDAGYHFHCSRPGESFRHLWQDINGVDSWHANPWVWVVEFKRVTP